MESNNKNKVALIIDIDGVIIQQKKKIPGSTEAIRLAQQKNIPFVFFTNNTAPTEQAKADQITELLELKLNPIKKEQIILNYTPIKKTFDSWHDKLVLFIGRQEINKILPFQQIPYYITIEEYCTLFPEAIPFRKNSQESKEKTKQIVQKRLNKKDLTIYNIKFDLIFILNSPVKWEQCIQVIMDLMSTDDGTITNQRQYIAHEDHIPIFTSLNDLWFRNNLHPLPRLLLKPFILALESVHREIYKKELNITHYGKPTKKAFEYVHKHLIQIYGQSQSYIMIGDNIDTDIKGAYNYGWESILVKTGVSRHPTQMANHFCNNLLEAIQWIIEEKKLK